jgi:hypothetical protein
MCQDNILQDQLVQLLMEKYTQIKVTINLQINQLDTKNIQYQARQLITKIRQIHQNIALILLEYHMDHLIIKTIIKILTVINNNLITM